MRFAFATLFLFACTASFAQDGGTDAGVIVDGGELDAGAVDAGDDVDAGGAVDAGAVDAGDVDAGDVDAGDVDAGDVDAGDVDAGDVDAGDVDAGELECGYTCTGDTLSFCDEGDVVEIDCTAEGARCGRVNDSWGNDCLLAAGAVCSPGYAEEESRCDREANLTCVVDTCEPCPTADCSPVFPLIATTPASSGDVPTVPGTEPDALSCLGCTDTPTLPFLSLVLVLAGFRLRRSRRHARAARS